MKYGHIQNTARTMNSSIPIINQFSLTCLFLTVQNHFFKGSIEMFKQVEKVLK